MKKPINLFVQSRDDKETEIDDEGSSLPNGSTKALLLPIELNDTINKEEVLKSIPKGGLLEIYNKKTDKSQDQLGFYINNELKITSKTYSENNITKTKPNFSLYVNDKGDYYKSKIKLKYLTNQIESKFIKLFFMEVIKEDTDTNKFNERNISLPKILSEIYFQNQASQYEKKCQFETSEVYSYGFVILPNIFRLQYNSVDQSYKFVDTNKIDYDIFYIEYRYLSHLTELKKLLTSDNCENEIREIKEIDNCLQRNSIYHNDLSTPGNILINPQNNQKYIIDFGEATSLASKPSMYPRCQKELHSNLGGRRIRMTKRRRKKNLRSVKNRCNLRSNLEV